ncbi:MAG TPA: hypothetical protein VFW37_05290 [Alphaproteobacteria bacterium]|nr:hypothetical protein [Alphaproteobacteria bacterium]
MADQAVFEKHTMTSSDDRNITKAPISRTSRLTGLSTRLEANSQCNLTNLIEVFGMAIPLFLK